MTKSLAKQLLHAPAATTLRRSAACADRPPPIGNQAALRRLSPSPIGLQTKLTIGAVNDPLEQQADVAADQVMRMADASVAPFSAQTLTRKCSDCDDGEPPLQRKAANAGMAGTIAPPIVDAVLNSPGHALDPATHDFMASRFNTDFTAVRIHTDCASSRCAST